MVITISKKPNILITDSGIRKIIKVNKVYIILKNIKMSRIGILERRISNFFKKLAFDCSFFNMIGDNNLFYVSIISYVV